VKIAYDAPMTDLIRHKRALLIAGPTASGKSSLALDVAERLGNAGQKAAIINADSMQIYRETPILAACPTQEDKERAPHYLYECRSVAEPCSAGQYADLAAPLLQRLWGEGVFPIVVGGTGLYFRALSEGIAAIPDIPRERVEEAEAIVAAQGIVALHGMLDPAMQQRLNPTDTQRVVRAWSVLTETGRSLAEFQAAPLVPPLPDANFVKFALVPDREWLYARCDLRFDLMMAQGGLEEAQNLFNQNFPRNLPGMKALGLPELFAHFDGQQSLEDAVIAAKTGTRRYAKRQMTWIKTQMMSWNAISAQQMERSCDILINKIL